MEAKTRRAWEGLIRYANGEVNDASELTRIFAECMPWASAIEGFGLLDHPFAGGDRVLLEEAAKYEPSVEALLRWWCSEPDDPEGQPATRQEFAFLKQHAEHVGGMHLKDGYNPGMAEELNLSSSQQESIREQEQRIWARRGSSPLSTWVPSKDYKDLADVVCDFLLSEYQRYLNREQSRRDKQPAPIVPFFVCPKCNKLVMPKRAGRKKYCSECSDKARAERYRQNAPAGENKDYQWLYRLKQTQAALRKIRLRRPKDRKRLEEIKVRQQKSSRCQSLLLDMRL